MGLTRTKGNGPYAPLGCSYYLDDAIMAAGERAEVLFCRGLAFSSNADADGYITDRQLIPLGIGLPGLQQRAESLVREGIWERLDGGYQIRSWLKWNKSAEEIGRHLKRDRERKSTGIGPDSVRNPAGSGDESARLPAPTALHGTTRHGTAV